MVYGIIHTRVRTIRKGNMDISQLAGIVVDEQIAYFYNFRRKYFTVMGTSSNPNKPLEIDIKAEMNTLKDRHLEYPEFSWIKKSNLAELYLVHRLKAHLHQTNCLNNVTNEK